MQMAVYMCDGMCDGMPGAAVRVVAPWWPSFWLSNDLRSIGLSDHPWCVRWVVCRVEWNTACSQAISDSGLRMALACIWMAEWLCYVKESYGASGGITSHMDWSTVCRSGHCPIHDHRLPASIPIFGQQTSSNRHQGVWGGWREMCAGCCPM